ncbi:MAG: hypothetical protein KGL53_00160, partial [Elusimicrobia bacterium]|nr:hypothetical protein [Elusimicrobiota bacterium]
QQLFQRAARLTVGNLDGSTAFQTSFIPGSSVPGLRVSFQIKRSLRQEPASAHIKLYNASRDHRAQMKIRYAPVVLEAGYTNTIGRIFSGQARYIDHAREGPDWVTSIECGDGEVAYRYARFVESYAPGTSVLQVAQRLIAAIGPMTAASAAVLEGALTDQFARGYSVRGTAAQELHALLSGRGLAFSVQHGKVQVLQDGQATTDTAVLLTPDTGLLGSPEHGTPDPSEPRSASRTLKFRCLIQPTLNPGGLVQIKSQSAQGLLRVLSIETSGDTHGGDWAMTCEGAPRS